MSEPVRCVCGGEAQVKPVGGCRCVECHECGRRTPGHFAAGMAVEHWAKDQLALKSHEPLVKALEETLALATQSQPPDVFVKFEAILKPALALVEEKP